MAKIYHSEIYGLRQDKYNWLKTNNIKTTKWKQIKPKSEFYLFIPRDERTLKQYKKFVKITDIFPINSVGVVTARDNFVIDYDKQKLNRRFLQLKDKNLSDGIIKQTYSLKDNGNWNFKEARDKFNNNDDWKNQIIQILYRPFDKRWIFYDDIFIERTRKNVMKHFIVGKNLGLVTSRIIKGGKYQHTFISENISNASMLATNTSSSSYLFPLYLYEKEDNHLFNGSTNLLYKTSNISPDILEMLKQIQQGKEVISPEQIFFYIYAILYSNIYRTKYAEFLKIDFPMIPFTKDFKLFSKMAAYGNALIDLHLLKSSILSTPIVKFQGNGNSKVQKIIHKDSKVYINETQYFEGIGLEIWQYRIGEYQVLDKWLKDRKGKELSLDEIKTYCQIATSISETIKIQIEIDGIYNKVELGI